MVILPWMGAEAGLAPPGDGYTDKGLHILCFAGLSCLSLWAYRSRGGRIMAVLLLLVLAVGIELVQGMVPNRQASLEDVIADIVGIGLALILLRHWSLVRGMLFERMIKADRSGD
ncbi:VanZ family protein [Niveispirillum lacus]